MDNGWLFGLVVLVVGSLGGWFYDLVVLVVGSSGG